MTVIEVDLPPPAKWESEDYEDESNTGSNGIVKIALVGFSVAITVALIVLTLLAYIRKKKKETLKEKQENIEAGEQLLSTTDENWEVPDQVVLGQELGKAALKRLSINSFQANNYYSSW